MLVGGKNVAKEILVSNKHIKKIYLEDNFNDIDILSLIEDRNITPNYLSTKEINRFNKKRHQGIILEIDDFKYSPIEEFDVTNGKLVILDHLEDPHNLGAIIRTVEAAGFTGIVIPKDRSVEVNYTAEKASSGAATYVKIAKVTNLKQSIDYLKSIGYWIIGTSLETKDDYRDINYDGKIAIVIGNEGKGISPSLRKYLDYEVKIPMKGKINSLNASVAAGIMIYEAIRNDR